MCGVYAMNVQRQRLLRNMVYNVPVLLTVLVYLHFAIGYLLTFVCWTVLFA